MNYKEYKELDLAKLAEEVGDQWKKDNTFQKSIDLREGKEPFVFYEGPPSANGRPGIHHVMARTIKDIFCRYKTQKGHQVIRKAGWDTHGLPVELSVEKELGITKEDIGTKISIEEYNQKCRESVMKYTDLWSELTDKMGYWVNMDEPYITYENKYIESVWWLLGQLFDKNMLYKGYTIQPYSPKAGTGLSTHELNQPGAYRDVKDTTVTAQFLVKDSSRKQSLLGTDDAYILAWTTTPWTLPSNTALAVGPKIEYTLIATYNPYTFERVNVILATDLVGKHFKAEHEELPFDDYNSGDKKIPYKRLKTFLGTDLVGLKYEQLLPYTIPSENPEDAFQVIEGDYVSTEDGTGIVHIAPTFGADDARVAKAAGVPPMLVEDANKKLVPLVDLQGKFVDQMGDLAGKFVKNEYYDEGQAPEKSVDVEIAIQLKERNRAFKVEKYQHNYPHCWRTDKPVLYYPLDSWFVKTTEVKDRLIELNKTINWKPASTGTGRFGNWLENLQDWNLSRSRFWGIPIPIWTSEDKTENICISSVSQLKEEVEKSIQAGLMTSNPLEKFDQNDMSKENYLSFDLHKNEVDKIILVSPSGKPMTRESDLIDVWFDSGSMPYAQWHYPFENKELIDNNKHFPADFIAEGVDQTRGWFFTLHAIGTMCFDSIAYKNVVSNGLVLDKKGQKMSKRLGNAVDPFETLSKYGPDATRFYMITNAQPWDNLKFDQEGITEVQRKFFRALHNTYSFFSLYANVDGFDYTDAQIPISNRQEIDRWIISKLNSLIATVDKAYVDYEPTKAGRAIQEFVVDHLSNWYVRLCRKRFWRGDYSEDKKMAYQTLFSCLKVVAQLAAPIAPFYAERLFQDLQAKEENPQSVHIEHFPVPDSSVIDKALEEKMSIAQKISSMILSLRKKEKIKVRQPLQKIIIPALDDNFNKYISEVKDLILNEVNVKELEVMEDTSGLIVKSIKPNFKTLGPKYGKLMKQIAGAVQGFGENEISSLESGSLEISVEGESVTLNSEDVEILVQDIPGWLVSTEGKYTVALDIQISESLKEEGIARELVNRIQNLRKDKGLEVTDKIDLRIQSQEVLEKAVNNNLQYICSETLVANFEFVDELNGNGIEVDLSDDLKTIIYISKN
ncbi:MAG: isoleucine--tRNA ligase [Flavobacteriales bacterium]|nr:isoleucine--tRNA ligase [Flavobacteriales bacterium]